MEPKVLVVEDDVEINELLGEYLALEQIAYVPAFDGRSALDKAGSAHPDALVLDLMLPDITGYEVCRQISTHRATASTPVIMLTCMSQACDKEKGIASGAYRFLPKPFLPDDLIALLRAALDWKSTLATRQPTGSFDLTSSDAMPAFHGINEMICDVFARSRLPDALVARIREAFQALRTALLSFDQSHARATHVTVTYRLLAANALANGQADAIEWVITESTPGLVAEGLFAQSKQNTSAQALSGQPIAPPPATPMHPWLAFLTACGVTRVDQNTNAGRVSLTRPLAGDDSVPSVAIDGARVPTRLRHEALARRGR